MTRWILTILFVIQVTSHRCYSQDRELLSTKDRVIECLKKPCEMKLSSATLQELADTVKFKFDVNVFIEAQPIKELGLDQEHIRFTFDAQKISLRAALLKLLEPLDLTYAVQFESIVITSRDQADAKYWRAVVYDVTDLLTPNKRMPIPRGRANRFFSGVNFTDLIHIIMMTVRPDTWSAGTGPSQDCHGLSLRGKHLLVILQSEHGHMEIETLLADMRNSSGFSKNPHRTTD